MKDRLVPSEKEEEARLKWKGRDGSVKNIDAERNTALLAAIFGSQALTDFWESLTVCEVSTDNFLAMALVDMIIFLVLWARK